MKNHIAALQIDISHIEASEAKAKESAEKTLEKLADGTKKVFDKVKTDATTSLNTYFREGKRIEKEDFETKRRNVKEKQKEQQLSGIFSSWFSLPTKTTFSEDSDFDPSDPVIKFSNRREANNLIENIEGTVSGILSLAEETMKNAMDEIVTGFQSEFSQGVLTEAEGIIEQMKDRLKDSGFSVNLNIPNASRLKMNFAGSEMLSDVIAEKSKTVTHRRRQNGAWGTVCSWFSTSDWGWEEYQEKESFYEIDIRKIQKKTIEQIDNAFAGLDQAVAIHIKKPLNDAINGFFINFKNTVEQIRGDLLQSIRDQEQSKAEQDELSRRLKSLKKNIPEILTDSRALKEEVEPMIGGLAEQGV